MSDFVYITDSNDKIKVFREPDYIKFYDKIDPEGNTINIQVIDNVLRIIQGRETLEEFTDPKRFKQFKGTTQNDSWNEIADHLLSISSVESPVTPAINAGVASGKYTGDGSTAQSISGLGLKPKYLKIVNQETGDLQVIFIFETWNEVIDDDSGGQSLIHITSASALTVHLTSHDSIVSLDSDGFTVGDRGTDDHPNKTGQVYNYIAFG